MRVRKNPRRGIARLGADGSHRLVTMGFSGVGPSARGCADLEAGFGRAGMPGLIWEWLLGLVAVGFPWLLARRRAGVNLATLAGLVNLLYVCSYLLLVPAAEPSETASAALGLLAIDLAAWFAPDSLQRKLLTAVRWPTAKILLTLATASLVPLG